MSSNSWIYTQDTSNYATSDYLIMLGIAFGFSISLVAITIFCRNTCCRGRNGGVATRTAYEFRTDRGLSPSAVATLPTFGYRRNISSKSDGWGWAQCAVCLNLVQEEEMVRQLPKCKHLFHIECINIWLYSHSTCPLCRATVEPIETDERLPPA